MSKRVIIKFNDKESVVNVSADRITHDEGWIKAYNGENLVAMAWSECVDTAYISEKKETEK